MHHGLGMKMLIALIIATGLIAGRTTPSLFPPEVSQDVLPRFDFEAWSEAAPDTATGRSNTGHKVEVGGRIISAKTTEKGTMIVAGNCPSCSIRSTGRRRMYVG